MIIQILYLLIGDILNYFNILLTRSLKDNVDTYLTALPDILLNETQREVIKYVLKYQEDHGILPELDKLATTSFAVMINENLSKTTYSSLFEDALRELKNNYLAAEFTKYEIAIARKEPDSDQIMVRAAETVSRISINEVNNAEDIPFPIFGKFVGTAIDTGIPFIDQAIGGLFPGKFNLLFAPAGSGKTYLLSYVAAYNLLLGKKVLVIRGEMSEEEYIARLLGITMGFNADDAIREAEKDQKKADELDDMCKRYIAYIKTKGGGLYFTKAPMPYISQVRTAYRKTKADIVLIDGLYALPVRQKFNQEYEKDSAISTQVKEFCKNGVTIDGVKCHPRVLATTQMNREGYKNPNAGNESIGGSIRYAQDSDTAFSIKLSSVAFSESDYDIRQTKARGNSPVEGLMHVDWKTMRFGFSSAKFASLDVEDGIKSCGFKREDI